MFLSHFCLIVKLVFNTTLMRQVIDVLIIFSKYNSTVTSVQDVQDDDDREEQEEYGKGNNLGPKENPKKKNMKKFQRGDIISTSFHSFRSLWIYVVMLLLMMKSCEAFDKLPNGNGQSSDRPTSSLGGVVDEWIKDGTARETIVAKYGEIEIWDTSDVLSLRHVFNDKSTFNEDISKWDVSSVTTMRSSTSLSFFLSSFLSHLLSSYYLKHTFDQN